MNQASVGFQCPECVREGQKSVRRPRTALGAVGGSGMVTKTLVGINVAVFLLGLVWAASLGGVGNVLGGDTTPLHYLGSLWAPPYSDIVVEGLGIKVSGVAGGAYYRLLTSMFLHYGVIHLLFNMYVLWVIGQYLERELGPLRYLGLYLLSGLGGNVLTYLLADTGASITNANSWAWTAGASGCIFGLFGAMVLINRKLGRDMSGVYVILGLNLVITFLPGTNISWTGHIGGLLTGLALGAALAYAPRANRAMIQTVAFVGVLVVFVGLIAWRTSTLNTLLSSIT
nr:rhomboid family intramembrane serine protease [Stackebrandtia nassauensis]